MFKGLMRHRGAPYKLSGTSNTHRDTSGYTDHRNLYREFKEALKALAAYR